MSGIASSHSLPLSSHGFFCQYTHIARIRRARRSENGRDPSDVPSDSATARPKPKPTVHFERQASHVQRYSSSIGGDNESRRLKGVLSCSVRIVELNKRRGPSSARNAAERSSKTHQVGTHPNRRPRTMRPCCPHQRRCRSPRIRLPPTPLRRRRPSPCPSSRRPSSSQRRPHSPSAIRHRRCRTPHRRQVPFPRNRARCRLHNRVPYHRRNPDPCHRRNRVRCHRNPDRCRPHSPSNSPALPDSPSHPARWSRNSPPRPFCRPPASA